MSALNSTVVPVPAGEYVYVVDDTNARRGEREEGGREIDSRCWALMVETK